MAKKKWGGVGVGGKKQSSKMLGRKTETMIILMMKHARFLTDSKT